MVDSINELFINFLKSFKEGEYENHKYYDTIREISRKQSKKREPLIDNNFQMYSLDDIKDGSKLLQYNPPKTTDAIYYKETDDGKLSLYLIEFKFHNLDDPDAGDLLYAFVDQIFDSDNKKKYECLSENEKIDLNKIKQYYSDDVTNTLILKPIETIRVVLPCLYEEYYSKTTDVEKLDIEEFLNNIEKKYFVFVSTYTETGKFSRHNEEMISQSTGLEKYFDRLKTGKIIDYYEIRARSDFNDFLEYEQLEQD